MTVQRHILGVKVPLWYRDCMANSPNVLTATDSSFESEILKGSGVTLVDFWASWCGPCLALGPTIDALADEYKGKVKIYKVNVDENPETPSRYRVRGIPTMLVFKDGQMVDQLVGNQAKDNIVKALEKHIH